VTVSPLGDPFVEVYEPFTNLRALRVVPIHIEQDLLDFWRRLDPGSLIWVKSATDGMARIGAADVRCGSMVLKKGS